jgi:non-ribosomal peptide synthetase component E (peptide arylation enzyme)
VRSRAFTEQAARTPDAVAVILKDWQLTYDALVQRSNQLAHHPRDLGVGLEIVVGLYMERSPDLVGHHDRERRINALLSLGRAAARARPKRTRPMAHPKATSTTQNMIGAR